MRQDKIFAERLRNNGKSYDYISAVLDIPKSTLSSWFSSEEWSADVSLKLQEKAKVTLRTKIKSLNATRKIKLEEHYKKAEKEAEKEFVRYKDDPLFIASLMLYLGEGDKKFENGRVKIASTDPSVLKIFRNFLIKFCDYPLEKIKGLVIVYADLKIANCLAYWSDKAGILKSNFMKPTVIAGGHKARRLEYGTCAIHVSDKYLKKKLLTWIDLYKKQLAGS